jgi:glucokinase
VVGTPAGQIVARQQWASHAKRGPEAMIGEFLTHARALIQQHAGIGRIGVSIGGPLDSVKGIVLSPPNLPGWDNIPLKARLEAELKLPAGVLHDAAACALAEYRWGAGQNSERLAYFTCGTGMGIGMVFDGKPYLGAAGRSPEIGHARRWERGPRGFDKDGSVEGICSGEGLSRLAKWFHPERWPEGCPGAELARLARDGDAQAMEIIRASARATGQTCAWAADMLFLDCIILGSLAVHLGDLWLPTVRETFAAEVLDHVRQTCRVVPSALANLQDRSAIAAAG